MMDVRTRIEICRFGHQLNKKSLLRLIFLVRMLRGKGKSKKYKVRDNAVNRGELVKEGKKVDLVVKYK